MKKLPALLMSGFLVLSLASCQSPSQNLAEAYKAACEKTATLTATEYDCLPVCPDGSQWHFHEYRHGHRHETRYERQTEPENGVGFFTTLFGQSVDGTLVCTDGTMLHFSMGEKSKFAYTDEDLTSVGLDKGMSVDLTLPEGTEITTKQEDGNTVYCFELSGEELKSSNSFLMDSLTESMGADNQIGTIACEMSVNNEGYVVRQVLFHSDHDQPEWCRNDNEYGSGYETCQLWR